MRRVVNDNDNITRVENLANQNADSKYVARLSATDNDKFMDQLNGAIKFSKINW